MSTEKELPALPQWLQEALPKPKAPQVASLTSEGKILLTQPTGESETYATLEEFYRASREHEHDLKIEAEVNEAFGEGKHFLSFPNNDRTFTLVMGHTDEDRIKHLQYAYDEFLEVAEKYQQDPTDFARAWRFVDLHPAFWVLEDEEHRFHWKTEGHTNRVCVGVYRLETGETLVELETGSHTPDYLQHYGDWRLELGAFTYEEAFIELARRVHLLQNLDGTDREVDEEIFEKPEWVKELEERIKDFDSEAD